MKTKNVVILLFSLVIFTNCFAQKENKKDKNENKTETTEVVAPVTPVEVAPPSEQCLVNISLFNESAKNKQYADALAPWNAVYKECPGANKVIYSRGREIVQWELSQAKDPATYQKVFDKLMGMYDNRVKYFGNDDRYPTAWILGMKGIDYINLAKNDDLKKKGYAWLEQSIDGMKENSELEVLRLFVVVSSNIYKAEPTHGEKFIADYLKANEYIEAIANNSENKYSQYAKDLKQALDVLFVQSGVADCNTLDKIYADKVNENLNNADFLTKVCAFYKRVRCNESEIFFKASVALYKIQPSSEAANGCAEMSIKKKDYPTAIRFYEEATKLSTDNMEKAEYQYKVAQLYANLDSYSKAREAARNSIDYNPNNGKPYILIGKLYAGSNIYDDPVLRKTVYWVAVDKFVKAKAVDSSCADEANELISTYKRHFPSKEDMFFKTEIKEGTSFFVGGWIGESTTCRQ
jgi:tetratricopeptide (TPR) repeat protein